MLKSNAIKSRVVLDGSLPRPEKLILSTNGVTFIKPKWYLILKNKTFIPYRELTSFSLKRGLVKAKLFFKSNDSTVINDRGFSISDAIAIKRLIKKTQNYPEMVKSKLSDLVSNTTILVFLIQMM